MTSLETLGGRRRPLAWAWPRIDSVAVFAVTLLCVIAWARHAAIHYSYNHPDEVIAVKVAGGMVARRSLDSNWALAGLPDPFNVPQYNFSAYNMFCAAVFEVSRHVSWLRYVDPVQILRKVSFLLGLIGILLAFVTGRRLFGARAGLFAAVLVGFNPLLFQDALYARPETFVSALTLLTVYVLFMPRWPPLVRRALAALVIGVLVATKISMVGLVPLLFLADDLPEEGASFTARAMHYAAACIKSVPATLFAVLPPLALGFLVGAPAAPFNPDAFIEGVRALTTQYTSGHWPQGLPDGSLLERLGYAGAYFGSTAGWLWLLLISGSAALLVREGRLRALGLFLIVLASGVRMSTYAVFFERNLSHLVPVLCLFAGFALDRALAMAARFTPPAAARQAVAVGAMLLVLAAPAMVVYRLLAMELPGHSWKKQIRLRNDLQDRYGLQVIETGWLHFYDQTKLLADTCDMQLVEIGSPGDRETVASLGRLEKTGGFSEVGRADSPFANVPPSTLNTYFSPTTVFLFRAAKTADCQARPVRTVSRTYAAEVLPSRLVSADPAWTRGGASSALPDSFIGQDYFGSWSGDDAHTGKLTMLIDVGGAPQIVLPYATGPVTAGQSITIEDADSHGVLFHTDAIEPAIRWRLLRIRMPKGVRQIVLEASDAGAAWGQWLAVGTVRRGSAP